MATGTYLAVAAVAGDENGGRAARPLPPPAGQRDDNDDRAAGDRGTPTCVSTLTASASVFGDVCTFGHHTSVGDCALIRGYDAECSCVAVLGWFWISRDKVDERQKICCQPATQLRFALRGNRELGSGLFQKRKRPPQSFRPIYFEYSIASRDLEYRERRSSPQTLSDVDAQFSSFVASESIKEEIEHRAVQVLTEDGVVRTSAIS